jgi:hypothetical protein
MTKLEFSIRLITLLSCFGLIVYIISADKPVVIVASLISIIVAALSGDWSRLNGSTTTIINNDEGEQ